MRLPSEFRPCEDCKHFAALVDGNILMCKKMGRLFMVTVCRMYQREESRGFAGDFHGNYSNRPVSDRLEERR